jgi:hypothetical protein
MGLADDIADDITVAFLLLYFICQSISKEEKASVTENLGSLSPLYPLALVVGEPRSLHPRHGCCQSHGGPIVPGMINMKGNLSLLFYL